MSLAWKIKEERGSRILITMMRWIIFNLGRCTSRVVLYFIITYYFLVAQTKKKHSRQFLQKALKRPVTSLDVYKHFLYFGSTLLDRFYMMSDKKNSLSIEIINAEVVSKYLNAKTGCILLGSHLGSFDLLRILAQQVKDMKLKVVMDKEPSQYINQCLYGKDSPIQSDFINASDIDCVFKIEQTLQEGNVIGMLGDRVINQQRVLSCPFLGEYANFPNGPMLLAALANVPVILFFGIYLGGNRYKIIFELFEDHFSVSRSERQAKIDEYVRKYAARLEYYAKCYPYNWFNFYEYWKHDEH